MNIKNNYQKGEIEITSYPTEENIEPKMKYLESNHFIHYQSFYRKSLQRHRKVNRSKEFA